MSNSSSGEEEDDEQLLEEDKYGRLICRKSRKVYPTWERITKQSLADAFSDDSPRVSYSSEVEMGTSSESSKVSSAPVPTKNTNNFKNLDPEIYIGEATKKEAERRIGKSRFVIYHRLPDRHRGMMMAYRSAKKENHHFPVTSRPHFDFLTRKQITLFKVEWGPSSTSQSSGGHRRLNPEFSSLEDLITHYKTAFRDKWFFESILTK